MRAGKGGNQAGMDRICFQGRGSVHPEGDGVRCSVCTGIVSVTGVVLALKYLIFLGFFRLWTMENVVVIGFQPPPQGRGSIQLNVGFSLWFVPFPEGPGERRCSLKKMTALPIS